MKRTRSLKHLLLIHELAFIGLIVLAGAAGVLGIRLWDDSSQESQRIHVLVQEIQQTRGDLYRQMKELFDAFFLADSTAQIEYDTYTISIRQHFEKLDALAEGEAEHAAINNLRASYTEFLELTRDIFRQPSRLSDESLNKTLNIDLESGIFQRYEDVAAEAERLLAAKQQELEQRLQDAKRTSITLFIIPIAFAILLLLFSRMFLLRALVRPIEGIVHATTEISAGRLEHKAPEAGAAELATLSRAINHMAEELAHSQEALIRSEKQAAMGLLVPMLAHNIRNPLASIRATAQVADSVELDRDTRESLEGIISSVDRLERWTGSLLAYLHPLKPQLSHSHLRQIVEGALVPLQHRVREKSLKLKLPSWQKQDDSLFTDEHLLEQALYNLLQNAVEAAPNQSVLEINVLMSAATVRLQLADRGPGMPFKPDPHAISPGPSTKRFGTGLGIPFAFKVCEALSGSVEFSEREGGGTLITLELPRRHHVI
ncbi:sensor histidine kinase [Pseudomethylobacillus aquaticus]|uniref:histidine kinase n=1 Tax=Pseudomethylobacillus aquaticus TaxID=2676064 RepID=A0A3N0UV39_9PROT|nr:HAMP domain-containing sensor histidine kinase [Pseudomethylobacillus aquaticus]ROH84094.1 sensor histidine kinase [Pseudomethylobacillus aquaticus]